MITKCNGRGRGRLGAIALAALCAVLLCGSAAQTQQHPLEPLTAEELVKVRDILAGSGQFSANTNFAWIQLDEPPKAAVEAFAPGARFPRRAQLAAIDYDRRKSFTLVVDIDAGRIASATELRGVQPGLTGRDNAIARDIVDADASIRAALVRRGLKIGDKTSDSMRLFFMALGHDPSFDHLDARLVRVLFGSDQEAVNDFSPFIDTLMAVVDLNSKRVIKLHDTPGVAGAKVPHDAFDPAVRGAPIAVKPVVATQPEGRNFTVDGQVVTWQNWQFRFGFNGREGLVLYQLLFGDRGRRRSIAYRMSLSALVTSYGDPAELWSWMEYDDAANFGLGHLASAVRPGRELPANAVTLSPLLPAASAPGFSERLSDRIYLYERDGGNLIHYEQDNRRIHARARELVIGSLVSLGNYVYGVNWVFRPDGTFSFEAELGGIVLTKFVNAQVCEICKQLTRGPGSKGETRTFAATGDDRYGTLVHPGLAAVNHQHWFNLRLDFDVDGASNAVAERNARRARPDARFFTTSYTVFGKSADARRHADGHGSRTWVIYNPKSVNRSGRPAGYAVVPMDNTQTMIPRAREQGNQSFTFNHLWVTRQRPGQLHANGAYPNQARKSYADTLHSYAGSESIFDQDIVVWYSLGGTHVPRPEDYPLMSNMKMSVTFRPEGFFERNPALGLATVAE